MLNQAASEVDALATDLVDTNRVYAAVVMHVSIIPVPFYWPLHDKSMLVMSGALTKLDSFIPLTTARPSLGSVARHA